MSPIRLVVLIVTSAVILAAARPAEACKGCKRPTLRAQVDSAPRVFAGTVVAVGRRTVTVTVDVAWKGTVPATVVVSTTCRRGARVGATMLYIDREGRPSKWIEACLGIMADTAAARARVTALLGQPHAPAP